MSSQSQAVFSRAPRHIVKERPRVPTRALAESVRKPRTPVLPLCIYCPAELRRKESGVNREGEGKKAEGRQTKRRGQRAGEWKKERKTDQVGKEKSEKGEKQEGKGRGRLEGLRI